MSTSSRSCPNDRLADEIRAVFPDATEVTDDGPPWTTICKGRFGAFQIRYVPLDTGSTPADGSRCYVTGANS